MPTTTNLNLFHGQSLIAADGREFVAVDAGAVRAPEPDHSKIARELLEQANNWSSSDERDTVLATAQIHALLAIRQGLKPDNA
jgi:hypothetical protein